MGVREVCGSNTWDTFQLIVSFLRFLRARFNHPPDHRRRDKSPSLSDSASTRESILSISSEGQDAVWEYQS